MNRTKAICIYVHLCLFGCFPFSGEDYPVSDWSDGGEEEKKTVVTIAVYNVENFDLGGLYLGQYKHVAAFAAENSIDILVLHEVQKDSSGNDQALFSAALEELGYQMPYQGFSSMSDGYNASAVWSRYPLSNFEEILSENTRTVYVFNAAVNKKNVLFMSCHLKSGGDTKSVAIRIEEAHRIEKYISDNLEPSIGDIILLGDMNTMSAADRSSGGTIDILSLRSNNPDDETDDFYPVNYIELPNIFTYPLSKAILDHIILSPPARQKYIPNSIRIPTLYGDGPFGPSDHLPVVIKLNI